MRASRNTPTVFSPAQYCNNSLMVESPNTYDWPALITQANERVYRVAKRTPLEPAPAIGDAIGNQVLLKREDQQPVFSFKLRGAYNRIAALDDESAARGVICSSAGNHAQGVALAASMRSVPAVIVMPRTTPAIKVNAVRRYPVEVVLHGDNYDSAQSEAHRLAKARGLTFIHPFDDPLVIAGQATIGTELLQQTDNPDAIFVPIGGGGLAAGIAMAIRAANPGVKLIGVEPTQAASMKAAFEADAPVTLDRVGIFADGVAVRRVGELTYKICRDILDDIVTVTTDETCAAIRDIYEQTRTMVEPAGALAVAGIKRWVSDTGAVDKRLVAIVCGANLNFDRLRHIAERAAIGEHREALFAVSIAEEPGSFRQFCSVLGDRNVTEFNYRYNDAGEAHL
ncbi:MAG: threonine ammonia-lyase, biosynthetic, partial [Pseudomonadota bacterium]